MKKRKGLTLVEIIVSMALVTLVALVFLTVFGNGNRNILRAGKITDGTLNIQEVAAIFIGDKDIKSKQDLKLKSNSNLDGMNITIISPKEINVKINEDIVKVTGREIKIQNKKNNNIEITTFVPDN